MVMISLHDDFFGHAFQKSIRECPATAANSFSLLGEHLFVHLGRLFCATLIWFFGLSLAGCFLSFSPDLEHLGFRFHCFFFTYIQACTQRVLHDYAPVSPQHRIYFEYLDSKILQEVNDPVDMSPYSISRKQTRPNPGLSVTRRRSEDSQLLAYSKYCR